ncbi:MAG: transcription antitermination protein NusB [Saprospiraceae bacterium]|nr:transcription antitermination protein NusB [Saprospiraceae bacterium]
MLSRRSVRIKAMQFLFSLSRDEDLKFDEAAKRFWISIETTYDLYMYNLYLLMEVTKCAYQDAENRKTKHLPSAYDKKFTAKIDTNPLMNSLSENSELSKEFKKRNFESLKNTDYYKKIYNSFSKNEEYKKYIESENSKEDDLSILLDLYRHCRKSELFNELLEDGYPQWIDDKSVVVGSVKKTLKQLPAAESKFFDQYYPDDETVKEYGFELFKKTYEENDSLLEIIKPTLKNWDHERVAIIDMILLKMALSEYLYFETIPTTVTLNEYLEVSKMYSTAKSKDFINGILDRLKNDLTENKMIKKKTIK